jgi:hypothetical protein
MRRRRRVLLVVGGIASMKVVASLGATVTGTARGTANGTRPAAPGGGRVELAITDRVKPRRGLLAELIHKVLTTMQRI